MNIGSDTPNGRTAGHPSLAVCIVTYERPEFLRRCLDSVARSGDIARVVVVDSSTVDDHHAIDGLEVPADYVHTPQFAGWRTRARNKALQFVSEEIITYIDDDVVVHGGWATEIRDAFADPTLTAACGRTRNLLPGEEHYELPIGRLLPNGTLTEGFAAITAEPVEIDHGIGANMSFRVAALMEIGGFRHLYPGTALREETDVFLRLRLTGAIVKFLPRAVVDHLPAPHVVGNRFDLRYKLYSRRNHMVLLGRTYGLSSAILRRWLREQAHQVGRAGRPRRIAERAAVTTIGCAWGLGALLRSQPTCSDDLGRRVDH